MKKKIFLAHLKNIYTYLFLFIYNRILTYLILKFVNKFTNSTKTSKNRNKSFSMNHTYMYSDLLELNEFSSNLVKFQFLNFRLLMKCF